MKYVEGELREVRLCGGGAAVPVCANDMMEGLRHDGIVRMRFGPGEYGGSQNIKGITRGLKVTPFLTRGAARVLIQKGG
jgi:hypothetical protein